MKFNGKRDVDVPLAFVAQVLGDVQGWERAALRRGLDVRRTDALDRTATGAVVGATWTARFRFRGKWREVTLRIAEMDPNGQMTVAFAGKAAEGTARLTPLAMGARRTRLVATLEIKARSLPARLMFQSLKLARARTVRSFEDRLTAFCTEIENRHRAAGG